MIMKSVVISRYFGAPNLKRSHLRSMQSEKLKIFTVRARVPRQKNTLLIIRNYELGEEFSLRKLERVMSQGKKGQILQK